MSDEWAREVAQRVLDQYAQEAADYARSLMPRQSAMYNVTRDMTAEQLERWLRRERTERRADPAARPL